MSWLPPESPAEPPTGRVWRPPSLEGVDLEGLGYVVVEEILENGVTLLFSDWPTVDDDGRLQFGRMQSIEVPVDRDALERFLADSRLPTELGVRPLRTGDAFAARARRDLRAQPPTAAERRRPEDWLDSPVYDISADARDVAKSAFYAAVAPTLDGVQVSQIEEIVERPPPPATAGSGGGGRIPIRWLMASVVLLVAGVGAGIAVGSVVGGDTTTTTTTVRRGSTTTTTVTRSVPTTETETETETETVTETVTTEAAPKPDLIVSVATDGVRVSCDGDVCTTSVDYEVANISPQARVSQPFAVSITSVSPSDTGTVTETVTETVDGLGADSALALSTSLPDDAACTDPSCVITIEVDSAEVIRESSEDNNTAEGSPPPPVD